MSILNVKEDVSAVAAVLNPEVDKSVATLAQAIKDAVPHLLDSLEGLTISVSITITRKPA